MGCFYIVEIPALLLGEEMEKVKKIIIEVHLYTNKIEALIKTVIWIISWIGGILVLLDTTDKNVLGSAYFIYTLSLLMEFVPKIYGKAEPWSRFLHTVFCFTIAIVCVLAAAILFGATLSNGFFTLMLVLTCFVIAYMVIDTFALWMELDRGVKNMEEKNNSKDLVESKFEEKLISGNLGNIGKGIENNEQNVSVIKWKRWKWKNNTCA